MTANRAPLDRQTFRGVIATSDGRAVRAECTVIDGTGYVRAHDGATYIVSQEWLAEMVAAFERLQLTLIELAQPPRDDAPVEKAAPSADPQPGTHHPMTMQNPEIRHGILRAWDSVNYLATVQMSGSQAQYVAAVPVARDIASVEMVLGRKVALAFFDPSNPADAVVLAVWT